MVNFRNLFDFEFFIDFLRNNNVVTVGVMNKSDLPNKVVLDFSKDNTIKLSSKKSKLEKVKGFILIQKKTYHLNTN